MYYKYSNLFASSLYTHMYVSVLNDQRKTARLTIFFSLSHPNPDYTYFKKVNSKQATVQVPASHFPSHSKSGRMTSMTYFANTQCIVG